MATCNLVACQIAIANRSRGDDLLNEKPRRTLLARLRHDLRRRGSVPNTTPFSGIAHPPTVRVCAGPPTPTGPRRAGALSNSPVDRQPLRALRRPVMCKPARATTSGRSHGGKA